MEPFNAAWDAYLARFGKLIYMISKRVSGDFVTCEAEDNQQDLYTSGIDSILAWKRKFPDLTYEQIIEDPDFGKYTKTCLWNSKNKKGKNITKKLFLHKNKLSLDNFEASS